MKEIAIPEDISKYEASFIFGMTARQLMFVLVGLAFGAPAFFALKAIDMTLAFIVTAILAAPFIVCAFVKVYSMRMEDFLRSAIISNVLSPKKRKYETDETAFKEYFGFDKPKKLVKTTKKQLKANPDLKGYK